MATLTDQVIMPGSDYQAICDATRTLTGKIGTLKSGEIAAQLNSVTPEKETWVLNDGQIDNIPSFSGAVKFTSFGTDFFGISTTAVSIIYWNDVDGEEVTVAAEEGAWASPQYRKLVFDTPPTGDLLTWLQFMGVKQPANLSVQPSKDVTITSNGTTEITPDAPYDVMKKANLTVNVESSTSVSPKDINFYDYDGTLVAAWELSELAGKTALPDYPTHDGLTCQGWNWTLADLKAENAKMNVGAMYITTDGKTRIYITLQEGRTSPMLGIRLEGTVTVDWGDGTTPDTLTGTNIINAKWTPTHNYASPGDYVITLTVNNGTFGIFGDSGGNLLRYTSGSDNRNYAYWSAIRRIFLGSGITTIYKNAFQYYRGLTQITLPSSITGIGSYVFSGCNSLTQITLPSGITDIGLNMFANSYSLARIILPSSITDIDNYAFSACYSLAQITLPNSVTTINISAFNNCNSLTQITLPSGVTSISNYAFASCGSLTQITLPSGVTSIGSYAFQACYGIAFYDFTACTAVPTLSNKNAFNGIPADCKIRVPAALLDEWKAATNWATYASKIVGV